MDDKVRAGIKLVGHLERVEELCILMADVLQALADDAGLGVDADIVNVVSALRLVGEDAGVSAENIDSVVA